MAGINFSVEGIGDFTRGIKGFDGRLKGNTRKIWERIKYIVAYHVARLTPVDTGFLRHHWTSGYRVDAGKFIPTSKKTQAAIAALPSYVDLQEPSQAEIVKILRPVQNGPPFKSVTIGNGVEYGSRVVFNSRRKNFVERATVEAAFQIESEFNK